MQDRLAFVYSTDENYVKLTAVSVHSLLTHNPGATLVILTSGVSDASAAFLRQFVADRGGSCELIDVGGRLDELRQQQANGYTSYSIYARYLAPALLHGRFQRFVYLDCDTLIVDSLDNLSALDLHGKPFAIGHDCIHNSYKRLIGLDANRPYFNTGVLLVDIEHWIATSCSERFFSCLSERLGKPSVLPDQDILAFSLAGDATILPPRYNFLTHFQLFRTAKDARFVMDIPAACWYGDTEYAEAQAKPAIHHFLGHTLGRPWFKESKNPLRALYVQTAAEAGVSEVAEQSRPLDFGYRVQWLCWKLLPRPLFLFACRAMYRYYFKSRYGV